MATGKSNNDWTHPYDQDHRIPKMKDGHAQLAHETEPFRDCRRSFLPRWFLAKGWRSSQRCQPT